MFTQWLTSSAMLMSLTSVVIVAAVCSLVEKQKETANHRRSVSKEEKNARLVDVAGDYNFRLWVNVVI